MTNLLMGDYLAEFVDGDAGFEWVTPSGFRRKGNRLKTTSFVLLGSVPEGAAVPQVDDTFTWIDHEEEPRLKVVEVKRMFADLDFPVELLWITLDGLW